MADNYKESESIVLGDYIFICEGEVKGQRIIQETAVAVNDIFFEKHREITNMRKSIEETMVLISGIPDYLNLKKEEGKARTRKSFKEVEQCIRLHKK